jgi:hypothetical protein
LGRLAANSNKQKRFRFGTVGGLPSQSKWN